MLETLKSYCENDVVMTTLLFFYLLHFKKIYLDGEEYLYDIPKFLAYAKPFEAKVDPNKMHGQSLLS
ncbi:MAG: hypothetical protein LBO09_08345 [Candidatus Peribacteria bacterium]|nr:hypothetical protein [Candidatus Peribacteria bacterium]